MNAAQLIGAYAPQIHEAVKALQEQNDPGPMLNLAPDLMRAVSESQAENERKSRAQFIAHLAASLCGGSVETCENEDDATEIARRAVRLASKIVGESMAVTGAAT